MAMSKFYKDDFRNKTPDERRRVLMDATGVIVQNTAILSRRVGRKPMHE